MSLDDATTRPSFHRRTGSHAQGRDDETTVLDGARVAPTRPLIGVDARTPLAWIEWFGVGRLAIAAASVVAIAFGLWWLLRAPPVPVEQTLPFATADTGVATDAAQPERSEAAGEGRSESSIGLAATASTLGESTLGESTGQTVAVVHVAGNVVYPGVYTMAAGSRVADAVDAAGGASAEGDLNSLNLAAVVVDGGRIYVPARGEVDPASVAASASGTASQPASNPAGAAPGDAGGVAALVDINSAAAAELETLPGIGPATATAIVEDRQRNGPFASVEELERVRGIGPAKLAGLIDLITT